MYSRLEKILILKSLSIFENISTEQLNVIAEITTEVSAIENTKLITKNEYGDYMMVLVSGQVRVHDGEKEIAVLKNGDFFGELSILDGEKRSADITTDTECVLFKISKNDFTMILENYNQISGSMIKVLSQRLRDTTKKLYN